MSENQNAIPSPSFSSSSISDIDEDDPVGQPLHQTDPLSSRDKFERLKGKFDSFSLLKHFLARLPASAREAHCKSMLEKTVMQVASAGMWHSVATFDKHKTRLMLLPLEPESNPTTETALVRQYSPAFSFASTLSDEPNSLNDVPIPLPYSSPPPLPKNKQCVSTSHEKNPWNIISQPQEPQTQPFSFRAPNGAYELGKPKDGY